VFPSEFLQNSFALALYQVRTALDALLVAAAIDTPVQIGQTGL
jgi:hypothetical protein